MYGKVGSKTNKGNYTPVWELRKTDETFVNSFAGEVWSWGWTNMCPYFKDGLTQNKYMFTSNNVCTLSYHNNKHGDYIGESYFIYHANIKYDKIHVCSRLHGKQ